MKEKEYKKLEKGDVIYFNGFYSLPFYVIEKLKKDKIKAKSKNKGIIVEFSYKEFERKNKYNVEISE